MIVTLSCCVPAAVAPKQATPLLSAEYLAERELNRTGTAPEALLAKSASADKLSRLPSCSSKRSASAKPKPIITVTPGSPENAAPVVAGTSSDSLSDSELSAISIKDVESLGVLQLGDDKAAAAGGKGLALPFKPMSVAFKDICYYVDAPGVRQTCHFLFNPNTNSCCVLLLLLLHQNNSAVTTCPTPRKSMVFCQHPGF
jgi:hypothetical protein